MNERFLADSRGDDFVGIQTYGRTVYGADGLAPAPAGVATNQMGEEIYPQALEATIREAWRIAGIPVIITENGLATEDDTQRLAYLRTALDGVAACLAEGIDVRGYIAWTAFDNFEWIFGYRPKFGLIAVDRTTQVRTPKPSASWLGRLALNTGGALVVLSEALPVIAGCGSDSSGLVGGAPPGDGGAQGRPGRVTNGPQLAGPNIGLVRAQARPVVGERGLAGDVQPGCPVGRQPLTVRVGRRQPESGVCRALRLSGRRMNSMKRMNSMNRSRSCGNLEAAHHRHMPLT